MNLYEARKESGLTQEQVARILEVPQNLYSYMEKGICLPTQDQLKTLCALYYKSDSDLVNPLEGFAIADAKVDLRAKYAVVYNAVPFGWENRISRKQLAEAMGLKDRAMRTIIGRATEEGVVICNEGDGYYRPASRIEAAYSTAMCRARLASISRKYKHMRKLIESGEVDDH